MTTRQTEYIGLQNCGAKADRKTNDSNTATNREAKQTSTRPVQQNIWTVWLTPHWPPPAARSPPLYNGWNSTQWPGLVADLIDWILKSLVRPYTT